MVTWWIIGVVADPLERILLEVIDTPEVGTKAAAGLTSTDLKLQYGVSLNVDDP